MKKDVKPECLLTYRLLSAKIIKRGDLMISFYGNGERHSPAIVIKVDEKGYVCRYNPYGDERREYFNLNPSGLFLRKVKGKLEIVAMTKDWEDSINILKRFGG